MSCKLKTIIVLANKNPLWVHVPQLNNDIWECGLLKWRFRGEMAVYISSEIV